MVPRSGQVPTTTSAPASRSRRTASPSSRTDSEGRTGVRDVVDADEDHRDVRLDRERPVDLPGQVAGLRPDERDGAEVHPAFGGFGEAGGQVGARGLLDASTPYPAAEESPSSATLTAGPERPLPYQPVQSRRLARGVADGARGRARLGAQHAVQGGAHDGEATAAERGGGRQLARRPGFPTSRGFYSEGHKLDACTT